MFFQKAVLAAALTSVAVAVPLAGAYTQCGGEGFSGSTACSAGFECKVQNPYYSQCVPSSSSGTGDNNAAAPSPSARGGACSRKLGSTTVAATSAVAVSSAAPSSTVESSAVAPSSAVASSVAAAPSSIASPSAAAPSASSSSAGSAAPSAAAGAVALPCVNIAGFDFGCSTDGTCNTANTLDPMTSATPSADKQMDHFVTDDGFAAFRLPVGMQYLFNNDIDGDLDATAFAAYDKLVTACTSVAKACIIDFHNYARWNGAIFGQGGPTNAQFAAAWSKVAAKYADNAKVVFGIMNEPHDVDINEWAVTVQAAVTAIRKAGAADQMILLPGNAYTSAATFVSGGSADALANVTNADGSTSNLIFDVHKYLDSDSSGTNAECVTDNIDDAFSPLATWLRQNKRQAWNTETGGGNTASCVSNLGRQIDYINQNSDVYVGYCGWAAGGFDQTYTLAETPKVSGSTLTDNELVAQVLAPKKST